MASEQTVKEAQPNEAKIEEIIKPDSGQPERAEINLVDSNSICATTNEDKNQIELKYSDTSLKLTRASAGLATWLKSDAEREKLLWLAKKQVKQLMEEAVTRKFVHEDSSSLLSLCVAIDACLSHGLKRRVLGLFKTSSSMALIHKIGKNLPLGLEILSLVQAEEARLLEVQRNKAKKFSSLSGSQQHRVQSESSRSLKWPSRAPAESQANLLHKRNLWIKLALIEKRLVEIIEYLTDNASKYYKQEALMANYVSAHILSSLLVGPSALTFKRYQPNEFQFEDPTAHDLISRHQLTNPIACLCQQEAIVSEQIITGPTLASDQVQHQNGSAAGALDRGTTSKRSPSPLGSGVERKSEVISRRRPLSLKGNFKGGTLITNCHHYSCQEISEHRQTRGYSLRSPSHSSQSPAYANGSLVGGENSSSNATNQLTGNQQPQQQQDLDENNQVAFDWPLWSPRVLHDILHQNSRSNLLYAKNNVLRETQTHQMTPGYLSLHQVNFTELILKWIPNQMINGTPQAVPIASNLNHSDSQGETAPTKGHKDEGEDCKRQIAVESSYLDLVVSIPLSRVVLLHCHFNSSKSCERSASQSEDGCAQDDVGQQKIDMEESLIFVEADGIQMAPFRFPKGGLRLFLSCLQNALGPDRYLDPAINLDEGSQKSPNCSQTDGSQQLSLDSSSICSERSMSSTQSRFDSLVRRLPSLKRRAQAKIESDAKTCKDSSCETAADQQGVSLPCMRANNLVYRIVSSKPQLEMAASKAQIDMTSSVSNGPTTIESPSSNLQSDIGTPSAGSTSSAGLRFRWSLSRMARFSPRNTGSSSISSSGGGGASGCEQQTFENVSLFDQGELLDACDETCSEQRQKPMGDKVDRNSRELAKIEAKLSELKKSTSDEVLQAFRTESIQTLCESMRRQITARAFYGWLSFCRKAKIIRTHLSHLIRQEANAFLPLVAVGIEPLANSVGDGSNGPQAGRDSPNSNLMRLNELYQMLPEHLRPNNQQVENQVKLGLSACQWDWLMENREEFGEAPLAKLVSWLVYSGGIESDQLRKLVWPHLLRHYLFADSDEAKRERDEQASKSYEASERDWISIERVVKQRDNEILASNMARAKRFIEASQLAAAEAAQLDTKSAQQEPQPDSISDSKGEKNQLASKQYSLPHPDESKHDPSSSSETNHKACEVASCENNADNAKEITPEERAELEDCCDQDEQQSHSIRPNKKQHRHRLESTGSVDSDASITDRFGNNVHRIDKDVQRCDRSYYYFKDSDNLNKLRRVMCTYVWQHLDVGYVQGMCDLAAPFLVIFDDELAAFNCFSQLMKRMVANFPQGIAMDQHFESLRYLMQVLDPKLFQVLQRNGDYPYFYFCYRWLLLDFKRELLYCDVFMVWETIWAAEFVVTEHFVVFVALAMVRFYRNIIIENNMDFTDTIKFFNEMAEKHDIKRIVSLARESVIELHSLIRTWT